MDRQARMFGIGWSEMLVIAMVALLVLGPKELPGALLTLGRAMGKLRTMANEFQRQFTEALRETELDELSKELDSLRRLDPDVAKTNWPASAAPRTDLLGPVPLTVKDVTKLVDTPNDEYSARQRSDAESPVLPPMGEHDGATPQDIRDEKL